MGFEKVRTLETDNTISLGGTNKKTNKPNPARIEGYFLGSRTVPDQKKKSGVSYIHVFQTAKGNVGVWGKTHMDNQLRAVTPGTMTRVTATGKTRSTKNGNMILFDVEIDSSNVIEVAGLNPAADDGGMDASPDEDSSYSSDDDGGGYEAAGEEEQEESEEAPEAVAPPVTAKANADRQARVQALLKNKGK